MTLMAIFLINLVSTEFNPPAAEATWHDPCSDLGHDQDHRRLCTLGFKVKQEHPKETLPDMERTCKLYMDRLSLAWTMDLLTVRSEPKSLCHHVIISYIIHLLIIHSGVPLLWEVMMHTKMKLKI